MLVTLYEGESCSGEHVDISEPNLDLGTLNWADRARAFRIRYGAIQLVTGPDDSGARYPESDEMYARMLGISRRLAAAAARGVADPDYLEIARRELYRGQCNCPYWHGAFGGLYLPISATPSTAV